MMDEPNKFEVCERCRAQREAGDLETALGCSSCKGTGITRAAASFVCNGCGGSMGYPGDSSPHGLVEVNVPGHYHSQFLLDTTTYGFSLCEACLRKMFDGCKIPPSIGFYMGDPGFKDYAEEHASYLWHRWRWAEGHVVKLNAGLCNATIACEHPALWRAIYCDGLALESRCDEHAKNGLSSSERLVSFADALAAETPRAVAELYLRTVGRKAPALTYFRFVPGCVLRVLALERGEGEAELERDEGDVPAGLWAPAGAPGVAGDNLDRHAFGDGAIYVGLRVDVRASGALGPIEGEEG